jgi:hypothetical protein
LFFATHGRRIPETVQCRGYVLDLIDPNAEGSQPLTILVRGLLDGQPTLIGPTEFAFWHKLSRKNGYQSAWLFRLYQHMHIVVLVAEQ